MEDNIIKSIQIDAENIYDLGVRVDNVEGLSSLTEEEISQICEFDSVDEIIGPPIASATRLGYVKIGDGLQITGDGRLSAIGGGSSSGGSGTGDYVHPSTHPGTMITYDSGNIEVNRGSGNELALSVEDALLGLAQKDLNLAQELDGKADASHGNHVPAKQTASNKVFLRNDNTWATVTPANIGAAASTHTHSTGDITGTLPLSKGGTGIQSLSDAPNNAIIRKGADVNYLYYTATEKGAFFAETENGRATFGTLPLTMGGTGSASNLANAPKNAIVKKIDGDNGTSLTYTATKNGAYFATAENGLAKFGTLPIPQGGTGGTTKAEARENLGCLGNSGTQQLSNGSFRLINASNAYNYGFSIARSTNGMSMYLDEDGFGRIRHNKINSSDYSVTEYGQSLKFAQNYISVGDVRFEDSRIYLNNSYGVRGMKAGRTEFTKANSECIGYVSADTNRATLGSWDNGYGVEIASPSVVFIKCNGVAPGTDDTRYSVRLTYGTVDNIGRGYFIPGYNTDSGTSYTDLGMSSKKWRNLWATNGTIETSDRNQKKDIESLPDIYVKLFDELGPVVYRMIDGDRKHTGFIAQDVEEIAERLGLSSKDLGFLCKDIKTKTRLDENDKEIEEPVLDENGEPVYVYSLRYNEYIAIIAAKIKKIEEEYNNKISSLESEVAELKAMVQKLV